MSIDSRRCCCFSYILQEIRLSLPLIQAIEFLSWGHHFFIIVYWIIYNHWGWVKPMLLLSSTLGNTLGLLFFLLLLLMVFILGQLFSELVTGLACFQLKFLLLLLVVVSSALTQLLLPALINQQINVIFLLLGWGRSHRYLSSIELYSLTLIISWEISSFFTVKYFIYFSWWNYLRPLCTWEYNLSLIDIHYAFKSANKTLIIWFLVKIHFLYVIIDLPELVYNLWLAWNFP